MTEGWRGCGRFSLTLVAWALPVVNFVLVMRTIYEGFVPDKLSLFWAIIFGVVLGVSTFLLFFEEAIEHPEIVIFNSIVVLILFLIVQPVAYRVLENEKRHKTTLKKRRELRRQRTPLSFRSVN